MSGAAESFGARLRRWRQQRGQTQMVLALDAAISARHLSWLETGRALPSRAMVLRLTQVLDLPPRERNAALLAAGFAPLYRETAWTAASLAPAQAALHRLLAAHEPAPALAVDAHWHLVASNRMVPLLLQAAAPALLQPPLNVLRVSLHPQGLAPMICNLPAWREHVLARLWRQCEANGDAVLRSLHAELAALPPPDRSSAADAMPAPALDDCVLPLSLQTPAGRLDFITTVTVFGAPHDLTLAELAIETLLPADEATAARLRQLQADAFSP